MPRSLEYKYDSLHHEVSPLRVAYSDVECYSQPDTEKHLPAVFGLYDVYEC